MKIDLKWLTVNQKGHMNALFASVDYNKGWSLSFPDVTQSKTTNS
jgi:hypothetical protein